MHKTAFFGRIPERAFTLRAERALKSRDLELLGLVMTYAATGRAVVEARQRTFARRLACSVRTVQRSLARLADQGLLTKQYRRDPQGRLLGLAYDVAPTLALMPRARASVSESPEATKTANGETGPNRAAPSTPPADPKRHPRQDKTETDVAERDNTPRAPRPADPTPPSSPAVAALIAQGVHPRVAATLLARCGPDRIRQVLGALTRRANVRDKAAWCVGCLLEDWDIAPTAPDAAKTPAARPQSHHPYCPPSADAPATEAPDPLDAMAPDARTRLEASARAQLLAEMPALRPSFERGRSQALVRARMRELLAAAATPAPGGRP